MAGINESVIEEIKARTDLAELIASYGIAVKHAGASAKACCPFHHEKTPSFNINTSRGFYHCFGCGESGDAIKFVQKMDGLTFMEAVRKLAEPLGIKIEEAKEDPQSGKRKRLLALMAELAAFYHRCLLKTKEAQIARDYLKARDLDEKTCEEWQIGYAPNGISTILKWAEKYGYTPEELEDAGVAKFNVQGSRFDVQEEGQRSKVKGQTEDGKIPLPDLSPLTSDLNADQAPSTRHQALSTGYHRFGGRLMFSIRDKQGRVVAFSGRQLVEKKNSGKYVNSPETLIFKKSNVLFGFDKAAANIAKSPHREVIACEGQIDTIRLHISGFPVAVASQGTAFTEEHARMLKRVCDAMVLAYDDDAAGHKATVKVGGMMLALEVPVRVAHIPDGDDPDSFLRSKGAAAFQKLIDESESIVSFQVRTERAKESDPKSIDAVARVSRAVLATIAKCPSAILRASMVDEAAGLLALPTAALSEELNKFKVESLKFKVEDGSSLNLEPQTSNLEPDAGADAGEVAPPPMREMALMSFLLSNDRDTTLDGMVGEFLPPQVFAHDFTRRFVEAWRVSVATGEDQIAVFAQTLKPHEQTWLDQLLVKGGLTNAGGQSATDILQDYIRRLWQDALRRKFGSLPARGGGEIDVECGKLLNDIHHIADINWCAVRNLIHDYIIKGS